MFHRVAALIILFLFIPIYSAADNTALLNRAVGEIAAYSETNHGLDVSLKESAPARAAIGAQIAYFKASNTDRNDQFGRSVALSGETFVVGAPNEDSDSTGSNGDEDDNSMPASGAAYVIVRNGVSGWIEQAYIKASNTDTADLFGSAVAIDGDTIVIGAPNEDSSATGVDGNQQSNSEEQSGAAYVFVRNGAGIWTQQAYLKASNTDGEGSEFLEFGDSFGFSVALSGDTIVIGAPGEDSASTSINGGSSDNSAESAGAAYVFVRDGDGDWSQQAYLKASNTDAGDRFGGAVAILDDRIVVGAMGEGSGATGVNGDQSDNSQLDSGAVYVFERGGFNAWAQTTYLKASNTDDEDLFGFALGLSNDRIIVGAIGEASNAVGVDGNQDNNSARLSGAAYVFTIDPSDNWSQEAYIKASNTDRDDLFAGSVAIFDDVIAVGALGEASVATGINGNESSNLAESAGAAYLFSRSAESIWSQQAYIKASNTDEDDLFGAALVMSDEVLLIGARGEASNAVGVNGNQFNNSSGSAGAAYVFELGGFTVGGSLDDLDGGQVTLQLNGTGDLTLDSNGSFAFPTGLSNGQSYVVTVSSQPDGNTPVCNVINPSGTINGSDVTDIQVQCFSDALFEDAFQATAQ